MRLTPCTPVLARPDGTTQVGIARPLILDGLTESQELLIAAAETASLGPETLADLGAAGDRLVLAGMLTEARAPEHGIVAIHTGGRLGLELGSALAAAGVTIGFVDTRPASDEPGLYPRRALVATCEGGAAWAVRERHPFARVTDASDPALAVLVSLGGAARHATARWEHDGLPHLLIDVDELGATVGPLVVPGATACGRCLALARTDHDPAWPLLLDQLSSRQARLSPALIPAAVAVASRMVLAHLEGGQESQEAWRIGADALPRFAPVQPHPDCGCVAPDGGSAAGAGKAVGADIASGDLAPPHEAESEQHGVPALRLLSEMDGTA